MIGLFTNPLIWKVLFWVGSAIAIQVMVEQWKNTLVNERNLQETIFSYEQQIVQKDKAYRQLEKIHEDLANVNQTSRRTIQKLESSLENIKSDNPDSVAGRCLDVHIPVNGLR